MHETLSTALVGALAGAFVTLAGHWLKYRRGTLELAIAREDAVTRRLHEAIEAQARLIDDLQEQVAALRAENAALRTEVTHLKNCVTQLEAELMAARAWRHGHRE